MSFPDGLQSYIVASCHPNNIDPNYSSKVDACLNFSNSLFSNILSQYNHLGQEETVKGLVKTCQDTASSLLNPAFGLTSEGVVNQCGKIMSSFKLVTNPNDIPHIDIPPPNTPAFQSMLRNCKGDAMDLKSGYITQHIKDGYQAASDFCSTIVLDSSSQNDIHSAIKQYKQNYASSCNSLFVGLLEGPDRATACQPYQ